jgi:hypothetical protein
MLVQRSICGKATAAKSCGWSQVKKRYVTATGDKRD